MISMELYKESKQEFVNVAHNLGYGKKLASVRSINFSDISDYKELIIFLDTLISADLASGSILESIIEPVFNILIEASQKNIEEYNSFINSFTTENRLLSTYNNGLTYALKIIAPCFFDAYTYSDHDNYYTFLASQYVPHLIKANSAFSKYISANSYKWESTSYAKEIREALIESHPPLKLAYNLEGLTDKIGEYNIIDGQVIVADTHRILIHQNTDKKAIIIYGHDHNGAFKGHQEEANLYLKGFNVLAIDARKHSIAKDDIANLIKKTDFNDLIEVHINMYGISAYLVSDTLLDLNGESFSLNRHRMVAASDMFKLIVKETGTTPLKVVISSCDSQLSTHKLSAILPNGSEILTLSEHQKINGQNYIFNETVAR